MVVRSRWSVAVAVLFAGCGEDPTDFSQITLERIEILSGTGQTGVAGQPLPQPIRARGVRSDGTASFTLVHFRIESGNGSISSSGTRASGNGGQIGVTALTDVTWTLGSASEPQLLRVFAVDRDTVSVTVAASVSAVGAR